MPMNYIEADDLFFSVVQDKGTPMFGTLSATAFPQTYRAIFGFCAKTNALKTAMFDMIESNNPYAFNAIFRCFCDHYLKFTYIFFRFMRERSDEVGRDYYSFCGAIESRDYLNALQVAEALIGNEVIGDMRAAINSVYPDVQEVGTAELERASGKFRYRAILRYLSVEVPGAVSGSNTFLASIIPTFAELSSFVHGGPSSDREMSTYAMSDAPSTCRERAELAFLMAASVFMFTALAVSREFPEHGQAAALTKSVMDRFNADAESRDA
jgi:hypothetical protein